MQNSRRENSLETDGYLSAQTRNKNSEKFYNAQKVCVLVLDFADFSNLLLNIT